MRISRNKIIPPALKWVLTGALLLFVAALPTSAQVFTNANGGIPGAYLSAVVHGDFDNDGKLDVLLAGEGYFGATTTVWRNLGNGAFADFADLYQDPISNTGVYQGSVAAADFFNTGRLDALVTGIGRASNPSTQLWHNLGGGNFVATTNTGLSPTDYNSVAVGDFDNDGKLDVVLWGNGDGNGILQVARGLGNGTFTNFNSGLNGNGNSSVGGVFAADFNNDGYTDILLGQVMWRNLGNGTFTNINSGLPGPALAVGDFNNDGYLDVVVNNGSYQIWRNLGNGTFTNTGAILPAIPSPTGLFPAVAAVGDYDNDGFSDIVLETGSYFSPSAQVWRNLGNGTFANVKSVAGATEGTLTWGDFNGDGRLDFLLTGQQGQDSNAHPIYTAQVWQSISGTPTNTPPTAPTNLTAQIKGHGGVRLNWAAATDDHTPTAGLNYNIRVGSASGGVDIVSPEANPLTGQRLVVQLGNAQERLFSLLTNLTGGTYYWSVQAIDTLFAGGAFATDSTFVIPPAISNATYINGQFQVTFPALATNSYTLQASTNLSTWATVTNLIPLTNGPAQLTDLNAASFPVRYYRLSCP